MCLRRSSRSTASCREPERDARSTHSSRPGAGPGGGRDRADADLATRDHAHLRGAPEEAESRVSGGPGPEGPTGPSRLLDCGAGPPLHAAALAVVRERQSSSGSITRSRAHEHRSCGEEPLPPTRRPCCPRSRRGEHVQACVARETASMARSQARLPVNDGVAAAWPSATSSRSPSPSPVAAARRLLCLAPGERCIRRSKEHTHDTRPDALHLHNCPSIALLVREHREQHHRLCDHVGSQAPTPR